MKIQYQLSKKDYKSFYRNYYLDLFQQIFVSFIFIAILIAGLNANLPNEYRMFLILFSSTLLVLVLLYIIFYTITIYYIFKQINANPSFYLKQQLSIQEEGILSVHINFEKTRKNENNDSINSANEEDSIINHSNENKLLKWENIHAIDSIKDFIYLKLINKQIKIIPKKAFSNELELINFIKIAQSYISKYHKNTLKNQLSPKEKKRYYQIGIICLIPVFGVIFGLIYISLGLTKYKDKNFVRIGIAGIILCLLISYGLIHVTQTSSKNMNEEFSQTKLNNLVKDIEYYKLVNKSYPDSLHQIKKEPSFFYTVDPIQMDHNRKDDAYRYQRIGDKYNLFSLGEDGIANTSDDIYPRVSEKEIQSIGLIKYTIVKDSL